MGRELQQADLVESGSHRIGFYYLSGELERQGICSDFLAVGTMAGFDAAKRGE